MTSDSPTNSTPTTKEKPAQSEKRPKNKGNFSGKVGGFIVEILLPLIVSLVLLYVLSGMVNIMVFGVTTVRIAAVVFVVVVSMILSYSIDTFLRGMRKTPPLSGKRRALVYRLRLVKYLLGGLLIPLAVMAAMNFIDLRGGGTVMDIYMRSIQNRLTEAPALQVGDVIVNGSNPATKVQGIKALQAIHTPEALDQLMRVMSEDRIVLEDAGAYAALVKAIASFGADAKIRLLDAFMKVPASKSMETGVISADLYARYFSSSLAAMKDEITAQTSDGSARDANIARVDQLSADIKANLQVIQGAGMIGKISYSPQDLIIDCLLSLDLKNDVDIKTFGKTIAADSNYSDEVRGKSLLLVAKYGDKVDMVILYPYLKNNSNLLQSKALEAITNLQAKVSGSEQPTPSN
jgi:hypothetical protein